MLERRATFTTEQQKHDNQKKKNSFCHLLQSFPRGKYQKSIFFLFHLCPLFFPRLEKRDDSFSIPGASVARGRENDETTLHKTELFSSCRPFFSSFFSCFHLIVEVIERKKNSSLGPSCSFLKVLTH